MAKNNSTTMEFVSAASYIVLAAGCSALFLGFPAFGMVAISLGFGGTSFRVMTASKYEKVFKALKLGIGDEYPYKIGKREVEGGIEYAFTNPAGITLDDYRGNQDAIEQYVHHPVKISAHNGYIYITEFDERY